ncbi:MAG: carbohydrate kinase family protein [Euryarchaeota archaeon]|nr:carbohydrate kinase family protein [Euryarchaeota archaeon]
MVEVIGIGALNMDKLYLVERIGEPGEEIWIDSASEQPGGSAANTIAGLARLGIETGFIGRAGDDSDGAYLRSEMKKDGVDVSGVEIAEGRTGMAIVLIDRNGERSMYVYPGVNDTLRLTSENLLYANDAKYLHLSSFAGETPFEMQKEILDHSGARISFAPGMFYARKGLDLLMDIISKTEIIFLNRYEMEILTGYYYREGAEKLNEIGAEIVVATLGEHGCYIRTSEMAISVPPAHTARVIDTTGAGDAFCAGFLYGMLKNRSLDECGRLGNWVAMECIGSVGAREGLPRAIEIVRD